MCSRNLQYRLACVLYFLTGRYKWYRGSCVKRRVHHLLFSPSPLELAQLCTVWAGYLWTVMLLWPGETMSRPTYRIMAELTNDYGWAVIFFTVSSIQAFRLAFCLSAGRWNNLIHLLYPAIWTFTTASMLLSVYPPPAAISGEIVITVLSVLVFVFRDEDEP